MNKKVTLKEKCDKLNLIAKSIKEIPDSWLKNNIKFIEWWKKEKDWNGKLRKRYHYRKKVFRTHVAIVHNNIIFNIEVSFKYNQEYTGWVFLDKSPFSAFYKNELFKNCYYVMRQGYRANPYLDFKHTRSMKSRYSYYELGYYEYAYRLNKYPWAKHQDNIEWLTNKYAETAYKEKWDKYTNLTFLRSGKWLVALGLIKHLKKNDLNKFLDLKIRKKHLSIYQDFLVMAKNHKWNYFDPNWRKLHDDLVEKRNKISEMQKVQAEKNLIEIKKIFKDKPKKYNITIEKPRDDKRLEKVGKIMNNCIGVNYKEPSEIFIAHIENYLIAVLYKNKKFDQILTYKNRAIPENWENRIKKEVLRSI